MPYRDPARKAASDRAYREAHLVEITERKQAYYAAHREEEIARTKRWYWADPERARERGRAYAAAHSQEAVERAAAWSTAHPERRKEIAANWHAQDVWAAARAFVSRSADRAARFGLGRGSLTKEIIARLHLLPCGYCGVMPAMGVDHVIPMSRGGPNALDNLVAACWPCNSRKRARLVVVPA